MHQAVFEVGGAVRDDSVFLFLYYYFFTLLSFYYLSLAEYNAFFFDWLEKNSAERRLF